MNFKSIFSAVSGPKALIAAGAAVLITGVVLIVKSNGGFDLGEDEVPAEPETVEN